MSGKQAPINKTIQFSVSINEPGETRELTLQGTLSYEFRMGLILITNYPLKQNNILQLNGSVNGYKSGVVKRVASCGKKYMVYVNLK
jgi:hypothetical protein